MTAAAEPVDLLEGAEWRATDTAPGIAEDPAALAALDPEWIAATVPGTAAGALRDAGRWEWGEEDQARLDGRDWWFATRLPALAGPGPWELRCAALATLATVWLDGEPIAESESMFVPVTVTLGSATPRDGADLVIRCASLDARLAQRHPRPRFKSRLPRHQALRWYRTTLLGRMPGWSRWAAPVGPTGPVSLRTLPAAGAIDDLRVQTRCLADGSGEVTVAFTLRGGPHPPADAVLDVDGVRAPLTVRADGDAVTAHGAVTLPTVERWWPHTHGAQPLSTVTVELDGERRSLRRVGFRELELDRKDGAFTLRVNGAEVFCRGVTWGVPDAASLTAPPAARVAELELARDAGLNLIRLGGYGLYEDALFWDTCDALGIMVWQDVMIAAVDPPDDPAYLAQLHAELDAQFGALGGRPALVMACGSSETYQQGSMLGLEPERYRSAVLEDVIPARIHELLPGVPYVPSSPSGGEPPIRTNEGVTHYFGVGAYLRAPDDARLAGVRFAAECLSFANPPERALVQRVYGSAAAAGHDPRWKLAVARDAGTSWDFEDARDHYVRELFGVDPLAVRYEDPERALDLGRAVVVELAGRVVADWRAPQSACAGAVMLAWRDLWPGAGWGILDSEGVPKAAFYGLARACAPQTVLLRDRGLNGLVADVHNDRPEPLQAELTLTCFDDGGATMETAVAPVSVNPGRSESIDAATLFGGFRDLTRAYRFSPSSPDAVLATLNDAAGHRLARAVYLPGGCARPATGPAGGGGLGLRGGARPDGAGRWALEISTERLATFVSIDAPGLRASDSWCHLAPGESMTVTLHGDGPPRGAVRALNASGEARITTETP